MTIRPTADHPRAQQSQAHPTESEPRTVRPVRPVAGTTVGRPVCMAAVSAAAVLALAGCHSAAANPSSASTGTAATPAPSSTTTVGPPFSSDPTAAGTDGDANDVSSGGTPTVPKNPGNASASGDGDRTAETVDTGPASSGVDQAGGLTGDYVADLAQLPDPSGGAGDMALQFMRALQTEQWALAAAELSLYTRDLLSYHKPTDVQAILDDVRQHAGGANLGTCTTSHPISDSAAAVTCGAVTVVVHVDTVLLPGVQISAEHPRDDVLPGPHTHAYTSSQL